MPIVRLTVTNVATLPAGEHGDSLLPGFVLRVYPSGVRAFGVASWDGRQKRRIRLGRVGQIPLAEARARAREIIEALSARQPLPLAPAEDGPLTVENLVTRCLKAIEIRPATRDEWERIAKVEIIPALGQRRAAELLRPEIRAWAEGITSRWVARHAVAVLRRCYTWGLDHDLVGANPCLRILVGRVTSNDRVLSTTELAALLRALVRGRRRFPAYSDATLLLLLTGVRRSAVLGMRRSELEGLDGSSPRWVIPGERSKGRRAHVVPLSIEAVDVVRRRLEAAQKCQHLFPAGHGSARDDVPMGWAGRWRSYLRRRVARALQARQRLRGEAIAPVPRWTVHGIRHSVATHLREDLDAAPDVVSLLLGHAITGPAVSRIYDRAAKLAERRTLLCAWARWLSRLCPYGQRGAR